MSEFLVCMNCYNVYGGKVRPCQNCEKQLTAIDENLAPMIIRLNQKGYTTWACCSSHLYCGTGGYIIFDKNYNLPEINVDGFILDSFDGNSAIRWTNNKYGDTDHFKVLANLHYMMYELNKYVIQL